MAEHFGNKNYQVVRATFTCAMYAADRVTQVEKLVGVDTETLYDSMREVRTCIYILYLYVVCNEFANASSVTLSLISKRSSMGSYTLFESSAIFSIFETRVLLV